MKISIYGLGALGKRHLEGVMKAAAETEKVEAVGLVDPMKSQSDLAALRDSLCDDKGLLTLDAVSADFMIDATSVEGRIGSLKSNANILVLEKPLFYTGASLRNFESAFAARDSLGKVTCVNHARRYWPFYQSLIETLRSLDIKVLRVVVELSNAGLLSNYGHFLDLVSWISNGGDNAVDEVRLDKIFDSKRVGFKEAFGSLRGRYSDVEYQIADITGSYNDVTVNVVISTDRGDIKIDEVKGSISASQELEDVFTTKSYDVQYCYQSNLSKLMIVDYITSGRIALPSAVEVMQNNRPIVNAIEEKYGDVKFT